MDADVAAPERPDECARGLNEQHKRAINKDCLIANIILNAHQIAVRLWG